MMLYIGIISLYFKIIFIIVIDINDSVYIIKCGEYSWFENIVGNKRL